MDVFEISSAVGGTTFFLWTMRVEEELGRPFFIDLEMLSEKADVAAEKILGTSLEVAVTKPDNSKRYFHGLVSRFSYLGKRGRYHRYQVHVRPWLWFLTRTTDCRIFQNLTVPDILEKVFRDKNGFSDFKRSLSGTYRTWDYCVQYRESDFDFVSRLMEQEGIYYYFEHAAGKHTLVMADSPGAHTKIPGNELPYRGGGDGRVGQDHLHTWNRWQEVQTATYVLQDYDFTKPNANLETRSQVTRQHALASFARYDYPGEYVVTGEGTAYAKARIEEQQSQHLRATAEGSSYDIAAGFKFNLVDFPRDSENGEYLCLKATYDIASGGIEQLSPDAQNRFDVIIEVGDAAQAFRARQTTPKPIIAGPQTAVVVGKEGEEIWTDEYGRVKVQFHWDREGKKNENSSCWVRVAQVWAGKTWGAIHVPRIGQEVVVEFLEGDPDRPLVTGRVYNKDQSVPYTLPDNATQSGIKSRSSKEGSGENFNELRFEDKKGEEQVYFHAEKNFDRVVENNDTLKVGFLKKDKGDQTIEIFNNQKTVIGNAESSDGSQTIDVWKNRTEQVLTGNELVTIAQGNRGIIVSKGSDTHTISEGNRTCEITKGNDKLDIPTGQRDTTIKGNDTTTITTGNRDTKIDTGNDTLTIATGNRETKIDTGNDTLTIASGNLTIDISAGKCAITAAQSIELVVGGSSIKIEPAKISLKSAEISIVGDAKVDVQSATTSVKGSAMVEIQGGLVKIN
ncbi:MAG: type VI secretion system tip protein VgrG [Planctomycetales bacterium]|nr:type VI secretion system tip protein VgrG [Planctomycetales bacterium]MBN8626462.1 type VI secretion system tip protein VgrG [Planctomycetota bacterium]